MILHPDEQQALDEISSDLAAAEPRLAAMLGIFTRLTAGEGDPPDEDLILASRPVARAPRRPGARRMPGRPRIFLPIALLVILVVGVVLGLRSQGSCATRHSAAAAAPGARAAACRGSSTPARSPAATPAAGPG
jgi:hypothetical protein